MEKRISLSVTWGFGEIVFRRGCSDPTPGIVTNLRLMPGAEDDPNTVVVWYGIQWVESETFDWHIKLELSSEHEPIFPAKSAKKLISKIYLKLSVAFLRNNLYRLPSRYWRLIQMQPAQDLPKKGPSVLPGEMKRLDLLLTPEIRELLDSARPDGYSRNEFIEEALWSHPLIAEAVNKRKIERRARPQPGRPSDVRA